MNGVKQVSFLAFNLSDLPQEATIVSATLKIKCHVISPASYVSAFVDQGAEWVGKEITWDTKPSFGTYIDANYVNTMNDWYTYSSGPLKGLISVANANREPVTIALKTGIQSSDEPGIVSFYPMRS